MLGPPQRQVSWGTHYGWLWWPMIEVKHIRLIAAIAELGTLSGAARYLGYSQPAVTQQVRALERHLRTPVIIRSSAGVRLTEAGEVLLRRGRHVTDALSLATAEIEAITGLRAGHVRIVSFPSGAATVLPSALGSMSKSFPGVTFSLGEAEPDEALRLLRRGECDIALVYEYLRSTGPAERIQLEFDEVAVPLVDERLHVALPSDHALTGHRRIRMVDLANDRWVAGCPACRGNLDALCSSVGFSPDVCFVTDDYVALQRLVAEGLGVALLPELMFLAGRGTGQLELRAIEPACIRRVQAVTTTQQTSVPSIGATLSALQDSAFSLRGSGQDARPV